MISLALAPDRVRLWEIVLASVTIDDLLNAAEAGNDLGDLGEERVRAFRDELSQLCGQLRSDKTQRIVSHELRACLGFYAVMGRVDKARPDVRLCACLLTLDRSTHNLSDFVESVLELECSPVFESASFLASVLHDWRDPSERHQIAAALAILFGAAMVKAADGARDMREADFGEMTDGRVSDPVSIERRRQRGLVGDWTGGWERLARQIEACAKTMHVAASD